VPVNENLQPKSSDSGEEPAYAERDKAALEDKGALKPCEACGGRFVPLGLRSFLQTIDEPGVMRRGFGTEMALAMCLDCGLMRFHSISLLEMDEGDAAG
jgi:hypothetical protein